LGEPAMPLSYESARFSAALMKGLKRSIGTGKMVVELFSDAISDSVCRNLSCNAIGCSLIIAAA